MKKNIKKLVCLLISSVLFFSICSAESLSASRAAYVQGCNSYFSGDWKDAVFMLKKAVSYAENDNPETYYLLISAELYAEENQNALADCNYFFENFSESLYISQVQYLKGRVLFNLGEYENAIVELSDFCHQNESHNMYPVALYWIGEALFACEKYDEAESIFERLILDFPENSKVAAARFKIESIAQRAREEKLLYLLKQTGEEYLAAKEDYEKQLRIYNSDSLTKKKLNEEQKKNQDLEERIKFLENQIELLQQEYAESDSLAKNDNSSENKNTFDELDLLQNSSVETMFAKKTDSEEQNVSPKEIDLIEQTPVKEKQVVKENQQSENTANMEAAEKTASVDSVKMLKEKALRAQKFLDSRSEKSE